MVKTEAVDLAFYITGVGDFPDSSLPLALAFVLTILGSYSKESLLMTQKANWPTDLTLLFFLL